MSDERSDRTTADRVVQILLRDYGRTFAAEAGIRLSRNTPAPLFRLLCLALLLSARIRSQVAVAAARALFAAGWTTPAKMAASTWAERTAVLNRAGYARYDEKTSRMLAETTNLLLDRWRGDLRNLREEAGRDAARERLLLREFKGIGDVGVDIFFREVQVVWDEIAPFVDARARRAAERLRLDADPASLAALVAPGDFARLVAALVRVDLARDHDAVLERAGA